MKTALTVGRYSTTALVSAGSDWLVFSALVSLAGAPHLASLMTARGVGGVVSFLGNRYWTWAAARHAPAAGQGGRFLALYAFGYLLAAGLFHLLADGLSVPPYPAKILTDAACFVVNFLAMPSYVFRARSGEAAG